MLRHYWLKKIEDAWKEKSVVWISGVRRVGKTFLCLSLKDAVYFDCELPSVRRMMESPEDFFDGLKGKRVILDEIHRLDDPSELLKIAADHYPDIQIIATGSSTLGASTKFKDTLTGRKRELWLCPMMMKDMEDFGVKDLKRRFLRGGLPAFFLAKNFPEKGFQEWVDAYWAKDIQELFRLERRHSFQKFFELLMVQSGGMFEASAFATPCEVSRPTISNYLSVLEATYVVHVIRPFSTHQAVEIVAAPKVYAFDTGFFCYYRGWDRLREEDLGTLWEHFVLNEIQGHLQHRDVRYWRDKQKHEIDFILTPRGKPPIAIECKWKADRTEDKNIKAFLDHYPKAKVLIVAHDHKRPYSRKIENRIIQYVSLADCIAALHLGDGR
ncbi:MAG: ATP-binding protein [Candidatus Omnitrophica bacterium]|nr:ATP-binding protein [Candidatus Omnitrophota bacterium]